ncbi:MAG: hypothetical protein JW719_09965 [Pirellulales bacterium]|nr:hypothetical protein [Pirellulales bacterium]
MGLLLLITILLPLVGAMTCRAARSTARRVARITTTATMLAAGVLVYAAPVRYCSSQASDPPVLLRPDFSIEESNAWFFMLAAVLSWTVMLCHWEVGRQREDRYYSLLLLVASGLLGLLAADNTMLRGVCFTLTLVPLFFLVGGWGGRHRRRTAARIVFLAFLGGLLALAASMTVELDAASHPSTGEAAFAAARNAQGPMILRTVPAVVLYAAAALSMILGNLAALRQDRLKRLLGCVSIAETGYLLTGLCVALAAAGRPARWDGLAASLFYLVAYVLAILGTLAALVHLGRRGKPVDHVDELAGLGRTHPATAAVLAISLLSLMGAAPLAGFWAKMAVLGSALETAARSNGPVAIPRAWFAILSVLVVVNVALGAAYYVRMVAMIYLRLPRRVLRAEGGRTVRALAFACALATIGIGACGGPPWRWALEASHGATVEAGKGDHDPSPCGRAG